MLDYIYLYLNVEYDFAFSGYLSKYFVLWYETKLIYLESFKTFEAQTF